MKTTRTLTLELVRHGTPHNQLLSPITEYLALCGNHGAVSVFLPFEHHEFLLRLDAMRYQELATEPLEAAMKRSAHAREIGQLMSGILGDIPGLKADLGGCPQHPDELIHLQLVVSAAELALLPFEAALAPPGSPGIGRPISLQTAMPMSITRQVRRAFTPTSGWPTTPRILCIISAAGGPVPAEAHVRVLRAAIAPWVRPTGQAQESTNNVGDLLTILTDASLEKIRQACSERAYTHVHILAHGRAYPVVGGTRFGLALDDEQSPSGMAVVSGERLALALRAHRDSASMKLSHPSVVTVASCDSGNVDTVIAPGASLAHTLHEAEIPFVVGSQFPLTFAGSIIMTHVLYSKLLWGADPRVVLHEVRQQLKLLEGELHDWASVVAYTSFPPDFDSRLCTTQISQAHDAAEAALARADALLTRPELQRKAPAPDGAVPPPLPPIPPKLEQRLGEELQSLTVARDRLLEALPQGGLHARRTAEIYGRCGSIEKRRAQIHYHEYEQARRDENSRRMRELDVQIRTTLEKSLSYYWEGLKHDFSSQWLATQYLSLRWLLDGQVEQKWWRVAEASSRVDLESPDEVQQHWAHGSLMEVYMLAPFMEPPPVHLPVDIERKDPMRPPQEVAKDAALYHAQKLAELVDRNSFHMYSTRRQLERYLDWFILYRLDQFDSQLQREPANESQRAQSVLRRRRALNWLVMLIHELLKLLPASTSPIAYPMPE